MFLSFLKFVLVLYLFFNTVSTFFFTIFSHTLVCNQINFELKVKTASVSTSNINDKVQIEQHEHYTKLERLMEEYLKVKALTINQTPELKQVFDVESPEESLRENEISTNHALYRFQKRALPSFKIKKKHEVKAGGKRYNSYGNRNMFYSGLQGGSSVIFLEFEI
jgi:hypothetical protein